mgnify:FL=1
MKQELFKRILTSLLLIPVVFFFILKGSFFFVFFLSVLFLISSIEWIKMNKKIELKFFGILLLFLSFFSSYFLFENSLINFLFILIICISTDVGGYIFGNLLKGPKLTKISPNKTYSGMLGSFLLSIISGYLFISNFDHGFIKNQNSDLYNLLLIIIILIISTVSQIGDLIISFYKRKSKVKNTGNIFPGHGGLLDRIDGMIFAFPFVYILDLIIL